MTTSILDDVKKISNIVLTDTAFDQDIILFVNGIFSTLNQLGVGPVNGFMITDSTTTWDAYIGTDLNLNDVKTYISLRVRLIFDPPATSFHTSSMQELVKELEWRLNVKREGESWTDPNPPSTPPVC